MRFCRRDFTRKTPWAVSLAIACVSLSAGSAEVVGENRILSLYNVHTKESATILYKKNGRYNPEGMKQVNWMFRDWRRNEPTSMDPSLIDLLWEVHAELDSREPIHIISGYRSRNTNDMLRRTVGGQASNSRHILGQAVDVHFPDIPLKQLRYTGLLHQRGGVGYYPTSGIPFVHLDTANVRHWPRMPRQEMALLFPDGRTKHKAPDGRPLTKADAVAARARNTDLAAQMDEFFALRQRVKAETQLAMLDNAPVPRPAPLARPPRAPTEDEASPTPPPAAPTVTTDLDSAPMVAPVPKLVERSARFTPGPQPKVEKRAGERREQTPQVAVADAPEVARLPPPVEIIRTTASQYDEEHPEELAYRPFPVAPFLTETSSPDDPILTEIFAIDLGRTLIFIDDVGEVLPMRLRPGPQEERVLWAQHFQGESVGYATLGERDLWGTTPVPDGLTQRPVSTKPR